MSGEKKLRVLCNGKEAQGPAEIKLVSSSGAAVRGLKSFGMAFFGGLLVLPIPLVHIFGAILLIASPFAGLFVALKSRGQIEGMAGSFDCPDCGAANVMEYQEGKAPFYGSCINCKNPYQVFPL